ncbi:MAG: hypothetical protein PHD18_01570 [Tolumonas sp.]|uniref:hypothetical protein n=1 Tax=uncultured Tolumonas sp. TaxID=263765 RepID=UPI002A0A1DA0|nr:hypothetical protein [uncultured Tolumonas sp.]MDD2841091.1 hypothetical protein [Tolumonas sp.]
MDDSSRHSDYYSAKFCFSCSFPHYLGVSAVESELPSDVDHLSVKLSAYSANQEAQNV